MFTRICQSVAFQPDVKITEINGYKKYQLKGIAVDSFNEAIDLSDRLFYNRTYHFTGSNSECVERLSSNQSDYSTFPSLYNEDTPIGVQVTVPFLTTKISMLSGHDITRIQWRDAATALSNFKHLEPSLYLYLMLLVVFLALSVMAGLCLLHHREQLEKCRVDTRRYSRRLSILYTADTIENNGWSFINILRLAAGEMVQVINGTSTNFKWISFLCALLSVFMVSSFNGVYSTSRIVVKEPYFIKTYEELINDPIALPYIFDQLSKTSHYFTQAEPNSLKGQVWSKVKREVSDIDERIVKEISRNLVERTKEIFHHMQSSNDVTISTSYANLVLSQLMCGASPEGELRRIIHRVDPSEGEKLEGWSISSRINTIHSDYVTKKFRRLIDSGILNQYVNTGPHDSFLLGWQVSGTSVEHRIKQEQVCSQENYSLEEEISDTKSVDYSYYFTCIQYCLIFFALAFIILCLEILVSRLKKPRQSWMLKTKRGRRRPHRRTFRPSHYLSAEDAP